MLSVSNIIISVKYDFNYTKLMILYLSSNIIFRLREISGGFKYIYICKWVVYDALHKLYITQVIIVFLSLF
jgi:hypothetical protein